MNGLRDALPQYVALRRALGTKLQEPARTLERFLDFLEREGSEFITSELALRWAMEPQGVQRATWARRLGMVRRFAAWFSTIDARTEVPPHRLLAPRRKRNKPHIFTEQEVDQLMAEATRLASPTGLRALTYTTLIGLLKASARGKLWRSTDPTWISKPVFSRFARPSLESRASCPSRTQRTRLFRSMQSSVMPCVRATGRTLFLFPSVAFGFRGVRPAAPSPESHALSVCAPPREATGSAVGRDFRTSATVLQRANSSSGIEPALTSEERCPNSQPISDTSMLPTLTGIWKRCRNSSNWLPSAWAGTGPGVGVEKLQPAIPHPAFLHRSIAEATGRQSAHCSGLP
jgi:hypothetical protein